MYLIKVVPPDPRRTVEDEKAQRVFNVCHQAPNASPVVTTVHLHGRIQSGRRPSCGRCYVSPSRPTSPLRGHRRRTPDLLPRGGLAEPRRRNSRHSGPDLIRTPMSGPGRTRSPPGMLTDPTWDVDHNGVLAQRLPSGEVVVHVPLSLAKNGPCTVVHPVDRDVAT
jgi:hypothetical protein